MPSDSITSLMRRSENAWIEMNANRTLFMKAYEHTCPFRNTYFTDYAPNMTQHTPMEIYDSTAMIAANNFVNTMQDGLTPLNTRWAALKAGPAVPEENVDEFNAYLDEITKVIFQYIDASNFATASSEAYYDLGIGTMILYVIEGDEETPLIFNAAPLSQIAIEEGGNGSVNAVFRKHYLSATSIVQKWPESVEKLTNDIKSSLSKNNGNNKFWMHECTYYDKKDLVWRYEVIAESNQKIIVSREFPEQPVIVARWMKVPGFSTGIGPFIMALPDYSTINEMKKLSLSLAAFNVFGAYTVVPGSNVNLNTLYMAPGIFIPVDKNGGPDGPSISRLPDAGNFQIQEFMLEDLKTQIRQVMLDNRLPLETQPGRTAFEIAERIKAIQTNIGASYGRLQFEYITPLFRRIVGILSRKGLLPIPVGESIDIDNLMLSVQVLSPIASRQKVEDVNKLVNMHQVLQALAPSISTLAIKEEDLPSWLGNMLGAPSSLLRSKTEIDDLIEQQRNAMQQNQIGEALQQLGGIQG